MSLTNKHLQNFKRIAAEQLRTPYKYGAKVCLTCAKPAAFDCSSLTLYLYYRALNITLPRTARLQFSKTVPIYSGKFKTADFLFFGGRKQITHVALIYSSTVIIEASSSKKMVKFSGLGEALRRKNFVYHARHKDLT